jgi:hypothetical protein
VILEFSVACTGIISRRKEVSRLKSFLYLVFYIPVYWFLCVVTCLTDFKLQW